MAADGQTVKSDAEYALTQGGIRVSTRDPNVWKLHEGDRKAIADALLSTFQTHWLDTAEDANRLGIKTEFATGDVQWDAERLS